MFHIDPATLRRSPILGVLIGLAIGAVVVYFVRSGWPEARALLAQKAPTALSVQEAVNQKGIRWVTVTGGQWHCDHAVTVRRRSTLMRLLMGPVDATEIPITSGGDEGLLVARFEKAASCADRADTPLTGVVGSVELFTSQCVTRSWRQAGKRIAVLNVGASPSKALVMLLWMGALLLGAAVFTGYYLKLMFPSGERYPAPRPLDQPVE